MQENISLKEFATFKTGGPASYFVRALSVEDIKNAVIFAQKNELPFFVLGCGSNILISDGGFRGVVIKIETKGIVAHVGFDKEKVMVTSASGELWDDLVNYCVENNLYGLENLSAIPGTVGASPVQNIGAYSMEVSQSLVSVEVFDVRSLSIRLLNKEECRFGYRDSIFKTREGKNFIITKVSFLLSKNGVLNTKYKDIEEYFSKKGIKNPSLKELRDAIITIRASKLPDLKKFGTAGSFFKNLVAPRKSISNLIKNYPLMPIFSAGEEDVKIPIAWIIDNVCGLKGFKKGSVGTYENQALVLVNYGGAKASEVKDFADFVIKSVKEKSGLEISPEVEYVGRF